LNPKPHNKTEPGYYADGSYGIRIENVVVVREARTPNNFGNKGFLGFERVTMVWPSLSFARLNRGHADPPFLAKAPMGRNLIDVSLLSADERAWVDAYHKEVWEKVSPLLEGDARAKAWLHRECAAL
jgi:Xaa-Pro aminopeptidase